MKIGGVEKKGTSRRNGREMREGNGGEYGQKTLYTCLKLLKNKFKKSFLKTVCGTKTYGRLDMVLMKSQIFTLKCWTRCFLELSFMLQEECIASVTSTLQICPGLSPSFATFTGPHK